MSVPTAPLSATIEALYADHHGWLVRWLRRRMGCPDHASDLAQDTFVRVLGRPQPIGPIDEPRAWLTTIAHGLVVDHVRRRAIEQAYLDALASLPQARAPSPEAHWAIVDALARIDAMLDGLPAKARAAFLLSRLEGMSYPQIAARLGVCLSSVEKYMALAIRHCLAARLAD